MGEFRRMTKIRFDTVTQIKELQGELKDVEEDLKIFLIKNNMAFFLKVDWARLEKHHDRWNEGGEIIG